MIIDIMYSILDRLVNENKGYCLIWGHLCGDYSKRSEDVK